MQTDFKAAYKQSAGFLFGIDEGIIPESEVGCVDPDFSWFSSTLEMNARLQAKSPCTLTF
jgi:hypothetical protein